MSSKKSTSVKNFSDRLRVLMDQLGFGYRQGAKFAQQIGVSGTTLSDVLNGKKGPSLKILSGIAKNFPSADVRWLLSGVRCCQGTEVRSEARESVALYGPPPRQQLLAMANEVLDSGMGYAASLTANICSFYEAVLTTRRWQDHEARLRSLERQKGRGGSESTAPSINRPVGDKGA